MLFPEGQVKLPAHSTGGFDHGDVHLPSGRVFVAQTANGTVEILDGVQKIHLASMGNCQEASGVLCPQKEEIVFAAARGTGKILVINPSLLNVKNEFTIGSRPNGLAFDSKRKRLLVLDVQDENARLVETHNGRVIASTKLPGRPRWCSYDRKTDAFIINIKEPSQVVFLKAGILEQFRIAEISIAGPHGLDIDSEKRIAFVACDGGSVVTLDLDSNREISEISIAGEPDVIWFNVQRDLLYCAVGKQGVIQVIDTRTSKIIQELKTEEGAHTFAFDNFRQRLYAFLPRSCLASIYKETS
ncbi:MAG: YncE family protein [Nitrososphaerales archaeon]